jgi:hypothetical protein
VSALVQLLLGQSHGRRGRHVVPSYDAPGTTYVAPMHGDVAWLSAADLVLDVPDAPELLSLFITRAVVDDVLPPAIVAR